jgi:hypothetical protein
MSVYEKLDTTLVKRELRIGVMNLYARFAKIKNLYARTSTKDDKYSSVS